MEKTRGFEICEAYRGQGIHLPRRQTPGSAGYDLEAAEDIVIPSIWRLGFVRIFRLIRNGHYLSESDFRQADQILKPTMVPTGVKAYFPEDEMLIIANRSSNTTKWRFHLPNGIGVIDSDYYDNPADEGQIHIQLINYGVRDCHIRKGERVAQAIFMPILKTDDDQPVARPRTGGFGSSGKGGQ
jgi:dUTP pyrophosphatase